MTLYDALTFEGSPAGLDGFDWGREAAECVEEQMRFDGAHDVGHLARVYQNARRIARGEGERGRAIDWEVVAAAVLFHDVVNPPKDSPERERASAQSADVAARFFDGRRDLTGERLVRVRGAIEEHSYSRGLEPQTLEAEIVQDADRLEAIGAVGVARCFWVSGALEGRISHGADPFGDERELDDGAYAIDHFFEKLLDLRGSLRTETGRAIADDRHEFVVDFLEQFADEVGRR